eukprot:gene846-847_t
MRTAILVFVLVGQSGGFVTKTDVPEVSAIPQDFDCTWQRLAWNYAYQLQPDISRTSVRALWDALELQGCGDPYLERPETEINSRRLIDNDIFPNAIRASDFDSIQDAVDYGANKMDSATVLIDSGFHELKRPILLTKKHSRIRIVGGEKTILSGGKALKNLDWKRHAKNIFVAEVNQVSAIPSLFVDGERAVLARYPNNFQRVSSENVTWKEPKKYSEPKVLTDSNPDLQRLDRPVYQNHTVGIGGPCEIFDPPVSYWCSSDIHGGAATSFVLPSGFTFDASLLPNFPYKESKNVPHFDIWHFGKWGNWIFTANVSENGNHTVDVDFIDGGFQEARGGTYAGDFFVENVYEELDFPGEWFFDVDRSLLYFYNHVDELPAQEFVAAQLDQLIRIESAENILVENVSFRYTRPTHMDKHEVPSGGDWSLERNGAVFVTGSADCIIRRCEFDHIDSNGIMVSGANKNVNIANNEFRFIGGTAISLLGTTDEMSGKGVDGMTHKTYPDQTVVERNLVYNVGYYEKQSAMFFQGKSARTTLRENIFFNGPRSGINFNDGFGGGDAITNNLVFATCLETDDHGPFNSWDRQPFLTDIEGSGCWGRPANNDQPESGCSMLVAWRDISFNFFVAKSKDSDYNYNVDTDDGSSWYKVHDNVMIYGHAGLKIDFSGQDNLHFRNLYLFVTEAFHIENFRLGHEDMFKHNVAVLTNDQVGERPCVTTAVTDVAQPIIRRNHYFTESGELFVCNMSLEEFQRDRYVVGLNGDEALSTVDKWPSIDEIVQMVERKLLAGEKVELS